MAVLAERAGIPAGVFSVITGSADGDRRRDDRNPIVRKLTFTGSTEIGKQLMAQCAGTVKKVSLELGGNAPFIVFDDADLDAAVEGAIASKYRNTGQTCVCANRLLVQDGVYDAFVAKLAEAVRQLKVGRRQPKGARAGAADRRQARSRRSRNTSPTRSPRAPAIVVGGERHSLGGTFFEPTVLADVTPRCWSRGRRPSARSRRCSASSTEEQAIQHGQRHRIRPGLLLLHAATSAAVWRVAEALEYGMVGINTGLISTESGAVRRHQGIRHRPRGLQVRHRGIHRDQIPLHGRHRQLNRQLSDRALLLLLAAVTALGPIATNLYLPALPKVQEYFGATVAEVQATFSISLVMFALGILAWGPIADRFGRRNAILGGLAIMVCGSVASVFAQSLHWLIAGRALQAFGVATGLVTSRAIIADRYPADRMAKMLASLTMVAVLGNSLAPVLGGFLAAGFGWRAIFATLVLAASTVGFVAWRRLPETRPRDVHPPRAREMLATAASLVRKPLFMGCLLQGAVVYATFLVFISLAPYVMVSALGRSPTEFGFYYLFIALGYFSATGRSGG